MPGDLIPRQVTNLFCEFRFLHESQAGLLLSNLKALTFAHFAAHLKPQNFIELPKPYAILSFLSELTSGLGVGMTICLCFAVQVGQFQFRNSIATPSLCSNGLSDRTFPEKLKISRLR